MAGVEVYKRNCTRDINPDIEFDSQIIYTVNTNTIQNLEDLAGKIKKLREVIGK